MFLLIQSKLITGQFMCLMQGFIFSYAILKLIYTYRILKTNKLKRL